jgi:hypothetical protein
MLQVGAVEGQMLQELADRRLDAFGSAVAIRKAPQSLEGCRQAISIRQFQGGADQLMDLLTYRTTSEGVTDAAALRQQLQEQVKVAELQYPLTLVGELLHPGKVVDDDRLYALRGDRRDGLQCLLPARSAFPSRQQQRIEENGAVAVAGFEGSQIQDPGHRVELEPKTICQKDQRAWRNPLRCRTGDKSTKRLAEAIPIRWQFHARASGEELPERKSVHQDAAQNRCLRPMARATSLLRPNRPKSPPTSEEEIAWDGLRINRISLPFPKL